MIFLYGFLLTVGILLIVLLSIPIKVRLASTLEFLIQWAFLTARVVADQGDVQTELLLFNKKIEKRKKPDRKPKPAKKQKKETKSKKKVPFSFVKETLQDSAAKKVLFLLFSLLHRCFAAINIRLLHWNIGLNDYYWQGIIHGLVSGLPYTKQLQVRGNFEENNDFLLIVHISIWRILAAIAIFLLFFPYYRAVRIYFRFRAAT